ncbi:MULTISPECIES: CRISPR-associated helicase/endonuclease Cas3 [Paenibacillus]|uniref:CRISPR-associated helicase/endonuclease Cas3 n=1 Tax=Paenibacillus TaxID=44249 RepID=UPI00096D885F|nr:CRISPR-associated helicase/endonuclease Cas3 [Paenibacillus peoriae]OMF74893.1 CRISPR-associated helicase/endonuclease Cas3 [Paenibacillus peoriae]OMF82039.1 CRISPR-associated helicase/endonuclease Cas3 [Paenibacillus peoriae]
MKYIAHIRQKDGRIQTVRDHLQEVKESCEHYGGKIGVGHLAGLAGWLHDLGKNTNEFKTYIQGAVANPDAPSRRGSVDHSTAGGKLLFDRYHHSSSIHDKVTAEWIGNCIISHHQGLRDFIDPELNSPFFKRVSKDLEEFEQTVSEFFENVPQHELDQYFSEAKKELEHYLGLIKQHKLPSIAASLLMKYIFSCLIDADRTNTRQFEEGEEPEQPLDSHSFFKRSYDALTNMLETLENDSDSEEPINRLRREMSRQCEAFALRPSGIYTLSIPTGGGKTLASLRYALKHAMTFNKDRIIYIVPYTTIIEQNAAEIRGILQEDDMILEHHSNVIEGEDELENEDYDVHQKKIKLARDTWDRPIVFTTMVQFLNTFYAKGTRNVRRLHQLSNSVIIFDEVQSVPVKCISLFNAALNFLHIMGDSSLLLCTATQPALDFVKHKLHFSDQAEIIENMDEVGKSFKRVEVVNRTTTLGWRAEELADFVQEQMEEVNSLLVILNTKMAVRKLFDQLTQREGLGEGGARLFHLSTNMCAAHRKDVLSELKQALEANERVICVSTQLIEAGVNISFECVVRSLSGLDSIAQAAGRCNRHGKDKLRYVYIIKSADENLSRLPEIQIGREQTERILNEFEQNPQRFDYDLLSASAMKAYFEYYYHNIKEEMDYPVSKLEKNLFELLSANKDYYGAYKKKWGKNPEILSRPSIATAEQYFEVISNKATSVLVPYNDEAKELILAFNGELGSWELGGLLRKLQPYVVNIYDYELKKLEKNGDLYPLLHGHVLALRETAYSGQFGVGSEGEGEWSMAMI